MPCRPTIKPAGVRRYVLPGPNAGLLVRGNIDLFRRPIVRNGANYSTVFAMSFGTDQGEILVPRVFGTSVHSEPDAIRHFYRTGQHLGIFNNARNANRYALRLHRQQAQIYCLE